VNILTHQERQLMSILAQCRYTNGATPVVIKMAESICQCLDLIRRQAPFIQNDVVGCWRNSALSHALRYQKEIVSFWQCYHIISHGTRNGIVVVSKNSCIYSFAYYDVHELAFGTRRFVRLRQNIF
jgi:hypothetical protein